MDGVHKKYDEILFFVNATKLDCRIGGSNGYLARLYEGFRELDVDVPVVLRKKKSSSKIIPRLLTSLIFSRKWRKTLRERSHSLLYGYGADLCGILVREQKRALKKSGVRWVFVNSVRDFHLVSQFLKKENLDIKLSLMSHSPEAPSLEGVDVIKHQKIYPACEIVRRKKELQEIERRAFREADLVLFPSRGAMDPYFSTFCGFSEIMEKRKKDGRKELHFLATGTIPLKNKTHEQSNRGCDNLRVCFLGRHLPVKGYDLLVSAARKVWNVLPNAKFYIGGNQEETCAPPDDKRWREFGYVDPVKILDQSDVFVLPNRRTYYDLVLLEVLSYGIPVIATATGGNNDVAQLIGDAGLLLCEPSSDAIAEKIVEFSQKTTEEREKMRLANRRSYALHFTPRAFAERYLQLFDYLRSWE